MEKHVAGAKQKYTFIQIYFPLQEKLFLSPEHAVDNLFMRLMILTVMVTNTLRTPFSSSEGKSFSCQTGQVNMLLWRLSYPPVYYWVTNTDDDDRVSSLVTILRGKEPRSKFEQTTANLFEDNLFILLSSKLSGQIKICLRIRTSLTLY